MKIEVTVKASEKKDEVEKISDLQYRVFTKEPAKENKANIAVMFALARYFSTSLSNIRLIAGRTSKTKIFEIL